MIHHCKTEFNPAWHQFEYNAIERGKICPQEEIQLHKGSLNTTNTTYPTFIASWPCNDIVANASMKMETLWWLLSIFYLFMAHHHVIHISLPLFLFQFIFLIIEPVCKKAAEQYFVCSDFLTSLWRLQPRPTLHLTNFSSTLEKFNRTYRPFQHVDLLTETREIFWRS